MGGFGGKVRWQTARIFDVISFHLRVVCTHDKNKDTATRNINGKSDDGALVGKDEI